MEKDIQILQYQIKSSKEYKEKMKIIDLVCSVIKDRDARFKFREREIYKISFKAYKDNK